MTPNDNPSRPAIAKRAVLPQAPVTVTPEQLEALNQQLSKMRHDINNYVSVFMAAAELFPIRPEMAQSILATMSSQPQKILGAVKDFSDHFEQAFGITRP